MKNVLSENSQLPSSIELASCALATHNSKSTKGTCGICLDHPTAYNPLVNACQCTSRQVAVHAYCLQASIEHRIERLIDIESDWHTALVCQICMSKLAVSTHARYKCASGAKLRKAIQRKSFVFWTCVIGLIIAISLLAFTTDLIAKKTKMNFNSTSMGDQAVLVSGMLLTSIVSLLLSTKLMKGFFIHMEVEVVV